MYINGKWYEEPEIVAYVNSLINKVKEYKQELIETLHRASTCAKKLDGVDCVHCAYYYMGLDDVHCPSGLSESAARQRLEELCDDKS